MRVALLSVVLVVMGCSSASMPMADGGVAAGDAAEAPDSRPPAPSCDTCRAAEIAPSMACDPMRLVVREEIRDCVPYGVDRGQCAGCQPRCEVGEVSCAEPGIFVCDTGRSASCAR